MTTATLEHKEKFVSTAMRLRMEGREEGRVEEKIEIAKNLKQFGLSDDDIVKITKLPITEIKKLSN